jgi:general secretion pathway protein C
MGFDAWLRRLFPMIVCLMLLVVAYFQASGIASLMRSHLAPAGRASGLTSPSSPIAAGPAEKLTERGNAVLARHPFDSASGATAVVPASGHPAKQETAPAAADPLQDPRCDFGFVVLIAASSRAARSFAILRERGGSEIRRMGDQVEGHRVRYIGWDRVWLQAGGSRCQMRLGDAPHAPGGPVRPPSVQTAVRAAVSGALPSGARTAVGRRTGMSGTE